MARTTASDDRSLSLVAPFPAEKQLSLLGGFRLVSSGRTVAVPGDVQRLVAFVALSDRPASRGRVASALWPESSEARAGSSLRSALWRSRRLAPWLVDAGTDLEISSAVHVDVREARDVAGRLSELTTFPPEQPEAGSFSLDLLPDWYDDWVLLERERYRQVRLHALENLCRLLITRDRFAQAIDAALAAVAGEPLRESAHRALIQAHLAEGNVSEALRAYRSYRRLLQEELGVEPSEELERLVGALGS